MPSTSSSQTVSTASISMTSSAGMSTTVGYSGLYGVMKIDDTSICLQTSRRSSSRSANQSLSGLCFHNMVYRENFRLLIKSYIGGNSEGKLYHGIKDRDIEELTPFISIYFTYPFL
jgi:hypothetical protein